MVFDLLLDHKEEIEALRNKYKDEKQERKKMKGRTEHLEEEILEIKQEKQSAEKVCCFIFLLIFLTIKNNIVH